MKNFVAFFRISVIISAIIASTFPAIIALWAIPKSLTENQTNGAIYSIIFLMAIIGYSGWWRLLFFYNKKPLVNLFLLATGIASFIWFFSIDGDANYWNWNWPANKEERIEWYIFLYPPFIALCFVLTIVITVIKNNVKRNTST